MMKTQFDKTSLLALATMMAAGLPSQVMAQEAEAAEDSDSGIIVVTARNREENIQSVPLAITAFSEEDIARQSIQELDDVARFTPGFSFEDFSGGFAQPTIRGQATARVTALESNVSAFYDGIYIPRSWAVDLGTANLQRIEVVKGPQSARYGRNAFSGAINYLPKKAVLDGEISGEIEATVGIDERRDIGAFINFPSLITSLWLRLTIIQPMMAAGKTAIPLPMRIFPGRAPGAMSAAGRTSRFRFRPLPSCHQALPSKRPTIILMFRTRHARPTISPNRQEMAIAGMRGAFSLLLPPSH